MLRLVRYFGYRGLTVARAYMQYVWDPQGRKYLDAHTGHGAAFLGHQNPRVVERVRRQVEELMVCSPSFHCSVQDEALSALERIAPRHLSWVSFGSSGAEAVETALKAAWALTGRRRVVALRGSFHGRTLGALSVTWSPRHRRPFPVVEDVAWVDPGADPGEAAGYVTADTAAVIVEPVLGEGGVVPVNPELLKALREAAEERGAVFIVDEVQTGVGRCGEVWLSEALRLRPDALVAGKALGGGFPVSAVFMVDELARSLEGRHGSTFSANPLALAAVSAAVSVVVEDSVAEKARVKGSRLLAELRRRLGGARYVRSVRGLGLMVGVELRGDPGPVIRCLQERERVLALRAGVSVVRLLPPYVLDEHDIEWLAEGLERCLAGAGGL